MASFVFGLLASGILLADFFRVLLLAAFFAVFFATFFAAFFASFCVFFFP